MSFKVQGYSSELDIFSLPVVQTGIVDGNWCQYKPTTSVTDSRQIIFRLNGNGDQYLDFSRTYMVLKLQICNADGSLHDDTMLVGGVNNFFDSVIGDAKVEFNGKLVSDSMHNYHYRSYFEDLYNYNNEAKSTHLTASLWSQDIPGQMDSLTQAAFLERYAQTKQSRIVELAGKLHCDLFSSQKLFLNGVDVTITLLKNNPEICLMGPADETPTVKFLDATLWVRKVNVNPTVLMAHAKTLNSHTAKYPYKRVEIQTITLPSGVKSSCQENLFLGKIPSRIIMALLSNDAYTGNITKNPYNFQHYNLNHLSMVINGQQLMSRPYTPSFTGTEESYTMPYLFTFISTGNNMYDDGYCLGLTGYKNGFCTFIYDTTADQSASSSHWCPQKDGNIRVELGFSKPLPEAVTALFYCEYREVLEIDKNRDIAFQYKG